MALLNNTLVNTTQTILTGGYEYYLWTLTLSDPRSKGFLFVDSPLATILSTALYLTLVYLGPLFMQNKRAVSLKWILVPYNFAMAALNGYIAWELFVASHRLNYSYVCQPCRPIHSPDELRIVKAIWWYYISKLIEFLDTIFFILRKKDKQLTFLHVYHHSTMFILWWIGIKWVPSGSSFLPAMVNSFVHIIMYTYYGLSAMNSPRVNKYLWWKRYLTMMQLVQFVIALVMGVNAIRIGCDFPLWMHYALVLYMVSFLFLFGNFYIHAYIVSERKRRRQLVQNGSRTKKE